MSNQSDDEDEENPQTCEFEIVKGTKNDFISMIDETTETVGWLRKFRDYDCYEKMVGNQFQIHHYIARTKRNRYIGSCICIESDQYALLSIYYVSEDFRHRGIGKNLLEKIFVAGLKEQNVGVLATQPATPLCSRILNFRITADWHISCINFKNVDINKIKVDNNDLTIKSVRDIPFQDLLNYDTKVCKHKRSVFLKHWVYERFDCVSKVALDALNRIVGYGSGRLLSIAGYPALSPIYCDNEEVFLLIMKEILSCFPEEMEEKKQIGIWIPSVNIAKVRAVTADMCTFERGDEYIVQFTRSVPEVDIQYVYGISDTMLLI